MTADGDDPRIDPDLIRSGDSRNVLDRYRNWTEAAIQADIDEHRRPLHIVVENLGNDHNIGAIVRTANAFCVAAIHIVGRRRWNRRGAMATDRYQTIHHHSDINEFGEWARAAELRLFGIDVTAESLPIEGQQFPSNCGLVFGEEGGGLSPEAVDACEGVFHISQCGSTRSINVGHAAAVAMYHWTQNHA